MLVGVNYVPLLKGKVAEVTAYRNLSDEVKALTLPIFQVRPWQNANLLQLAVDRIRGAVGGNTLAITLDRDRRGGASSKPAQAEFDALFNAHAGNRAFYDFVSNVPEAVPTLQEATSPENLLLQLGNAAQLNRGLFVHFRQGATPPILNLAGSVPPLPHDTVFVVDAGWSRNYELLESWAISTVRRIVEAIPDPEIVVMSSSFPDSFGSIKGHGTINYHEQRLAAAVIQRFQNSRITYGDWGSTRPPQSGGGGDIPPRIDVPHLQGCNTFRASEDTDTFSSMATSAMAHTSFGSVPDCYGKRAIVATVTDGIIKNAAKSTEARINIHLTLQSRADGTISTNEVEYVD